MLGMAAIVAALAGSASLAVTGWRVSRGVKASAALRTPALVMVLGAAGAMLVLQAAIVSNDFSIGYVADVTATTTPLIFKVASAWAALEGSIVLWGLVLAGFTWLVARGVFRTAEPVDRLGAGALAVLGMIGVFWFGTILTVANPFAVCTVPAAVGCAATTWSPLAAAVAPAEGLGPNPLLQNHILMAIHPPMLYLGYVGMTVPYAFAMAALVRGDRGKVWLDRTHRWSIVAWTFLTLGLLLGAWWSYEVLGWGGYWAWDPVENAALIPWLVTTAFIHSAVVQRRRGMLQAWNFVLIIAAFSLTILGTFLTRSGVVDSVHSFTQSAIGPVLLAFLGVVVLGSTALLALRFDVVASSPRLESLASREGLFLLNNLLLTVFALTVLIGTLYPMLVEAFGGQQLSVGRSFFDRAAIPLAFALLLAMGLGPITPYRVAKASVVWPRVRTPIRLALVTGAAAVLVGVRSVGTVVAVVLASFVIGVIVRHLWTLARARPEPPVRALRTVVTGDRPYWGGQLAHVGIALVAVAIATSSALAVRGEVALSPGETGTAAGYCVRYDGPFTSNEPNRVVEGARVTLLDADCTAAIRSMEPRVNRYPNSPQPVATPDVRTGLFEDVYVTLAGGGAAEVLISVAVFPLMWLLWAGGLVVVAGGAWSLTGRRPGARTAPAEAALRGSVSGD